jgi:hypothetical protein
MSSPMRMLRAPSGLGPSPEGRSADPPDPSEADQAPTVMESRWRIPVTLHGSAARHRRGAGIAWGATGCDPTSE